MLESPNGARLRKRLRLAAQRTKLANDFNDAFEIWTSDRPAGSWDSGVLLESLTMKMSGKGKLYANGVGGPAAIEGMIYPESPYRFRTVTSILDVFRTSGEGTPNLAGAVLVLNRSRMFTIDAVKPEDQDDELVDVYLNEILGKPIPGAAVMP